MHQLSAFKMHSGEETKVCYYFTLLDFGRSPWKHYMRDLNLWYVLFLPFYRLLCLKTLWLLKMYLSIPPRLCSLPFCLFIIYLFIIYLLIVLYICMFVYYMISFILTNLVCDWLQLPLTILIPKFVALAIRPLMKTFSILNLNSSNHKAASYYHRIKVHFSSNIMHHVFDI